MAPADSRPPGCTGGKWANQGALSSGFAQVHWNDIKRYKTVAQKSLARPFCSQSPKRVGSGPFGPPISLGLAGGALAGGGAGVAGVSGAGFSVMTKGPGIFNVVD